MVSTITSWALYSLGASKARAGTLTAMALIEEPLPHDLGRHLFLDSWFAEGTRSEVKVAAVNYLSECELPSDLKKIETELARGDYQTRGAALDAVVRINLREGRQKALDELFELQTDQISERLVGLLFEHPAIH